MPIKPAPNLQRPFVPAKAGTQGGNLMSPSKLPWIPACAGMNGELGHAGDFLKGQS